MLKPDQHTAIAERLSLQHRIGERIADEVEKIAHGRQSNCEQAAKDILAMVEDRLTASADEVEAERKRSRALQQLRCEELAEHDADLTQAEADLASARKALEPFAEACDDADDESVRDDVNTWEAAIGMCITYGDFRRAREALRPEHPPAQDESE